jgi:hypothetical protein
MNDRLMNPQQVASRLACGITAAKFKMKNDLGGWFEPGLGWRCTQRAVNAFIASRTKQGATCQVDYPSSRDAQKAEPIGIATSELQTDAAISERSTSETTEPEKASERRSPPTGTSKAALRLASSLDAAKRARSGAPLQRSLKQKKLPS